MLSIRSELLICMRDRDRDLVEGSALVGSFGLVLDFSLFTFFNSLSPVIRGMSMCVGGVFFVRVNEFCREKEVLPFVCILYVFSTQAFDVEKIIR